MAEDEDWDDEEEPEEPLSDDGNIESGNYGFEED